MVNFNQTIVLAFHYRISNPYGQSTKKSEWKYRPLGGSQHLSQWEWAWGRICKLKLVCIIFTGLGAKDFQKGGKLLPGPHLMEAVKIAQFKHYCMKNNLTAANANNAGEFYQEQKAFGNNKKKKKKRKIRKEWTRGKEINHSIQMKKK